ncbi:DDE_3 domain-containing protein [Trichonephila clavipes]|nr:DDE_3 domain-containing protein [Trichonephila clavipes]
MNPHLHYSGPLGECSSGENQKYISSLQSFPTMKYEEGSVIVLVPGEHPMFQDDNDSVHNSRCIQTRLHEHDEVKHITWCPHSPDLNIIECLWGFSENKVRARFPLPRTLSELEMALREEWV